MKEQLPHNLQVSSKQQVEILATALRSLHEATERSNLSDVIAAMALVKSEAETLCIRLKLEENEWE